MTTTAPSARDWPTLDEAALYGLVGDFVRTVAPHTEADPVALLLQFLCAFGNAVGREPHFRVGLTRHGLNISCVVVGATSTARKGDSWQIVNPLLTAADTPPTTAKGVELPSRPWPDRLASGLSTGEGLIWSATHAICRTAIRIPASAINACSSSSPSCRGH